MGKRIVLYGGDAVMTFTPRQHRYRVNKRPISSFSTISGILDKPALIYWAVNCMYDALAGVKDDETGEWIQEPSWKAGVSYDEVAIETALQKAKKARFDKSGKALSIGSVAHNWLERYIKDKIAGVDKRRKMPINKEATYSIESYLDWENDHKVEYLFSERKVCSLEHWYAGTTDIIMRIDGRLEMPDFKTSKDIYSTNCMQLGAYSHAINEEIDYVDKLTHIDPDSEGLPPEKIKVGRVFRIPKDGGEIDDFVVEQLEDHFEAFRNCIELTSWSKWANKILKGRHDLVEAA